MGKQIYTTKNVTVGGTTVFVRQPVFRGRDGITKLIQDVVTDARQLVDETLRLCNPSAAGKDIKSGAFKAAVPAGLFQKLFLVAPDHATVSTVWANLGRISHGLNQSFGLKMYTQGDSSTNGYVNNYFPVSRMVKHRSSTGKMKWPVSFGHIRFGRCARVDGAVLRVASTGSALHGAGEIHVSFERLNSPMGPKTLIHEAGHKFANLDDFSYMYDFVYKDAITPAQALLNADTYAWLCFLAPSAAKDTADRRATQDAAASSDGVEDLSSMFG